MASRKTVLICLCGHSPAVITETAYCLVREGRDSIPSEIIAVTTSSGRDHIKRELFDSGKIDELRVELSLPPGTMRFSLAAYHIRLILSGDGCSDAADILSSEDSMASADFILNVLRSYTDDPDVNVILSIAGGRKTMGAIGALCLSLVGREQDRLCHVLVKPPFDSAALHPKFYFPSKSDLAHHTSDGKAYRDSEAKLVLCEIPYVRMRCHFRSQFGRLPGSYSSMVSSMNSETLPSREAPSLEIELRERRCAIEKELLKLSGQEFALYWLLANRAKSGLPSIDGEEELVNKLQAFVKRNGLPMSCDSIARRTWDSNTGDLRKTVSMIAKKIKTLRLSPSELKAVLPTRSKGKYGIGIPSESIRIF